MTTVVTKIDIAQAGGVAMRPWIALSAESRFVGATAGVVVRAGSTGCMGTPTHDAADAATTAVVNPALGGLTV